MEDKIKRIEHALTWLIERELRDDVTGDYLGKKVSELTERIFAGEYV